MPPPSRPEIEGPDSSGVVVLSGYAPPEAWVYANNETTGYSFGSRAAPVTGAYRFPILASVGDFISLFFRDGSEDSQAVEFKIPTFTAYPRGTGGASAAGASSSNAGMAGSAGAVGAYAGQGGAYAGQAGAYAGQAGYVVEP